jgi:hypothetical protein
MRPMVLLRLAFRLQDRRHWTLARCFTHLGASPSYVDYAMRRLM